jgi:hypothetical protein
MMMRQPSLFDDYVAPYQDTKTGWQKFDKNSKLHERLLANFDLCSAEERKKLYCRRSTDKFREQEEYDNVEDESDSEEEIKEEKEEQETTPSKMEDTIATVDLAQEELDYGDFYSTMKDRFIDGREGEFVDYTKIDHNEDLDDLEEEERDREEKYFDED